MERKTNFDYFDIEFYASLIETIQDGVCVIKESRIVYANQAFISIIGLSKDNIIGELFTQQIAPECVEQVEQRYLLRTQGGNPPDEYEFDIIRSDNQRRTVQLKAKAFQGKDKNIYEVCSLRDITLQKHLVQKLQESEKGLKQIIDNLPGIFYRTDAKGDITLVSPFSCRLFGYEMEEIIGHPLSQFYADPQQRELALKKIIGNQGKPCQIEVLIRHRDGSTIWVQTSAYARFDDKGVFLGIDGVSSNITERKILEKELRAIAIKDPLTQLLNRFGLQENLDNALRRARRKKHHVSIIFIDLNDFKQINDRFGHQSGDDYLVEFANRLSNSFRDSDLVGRIGGDEFIVLLDDHTVSAPIEKLLSRLSDAMREPILFDSHPVDFDYSLGIATFPEHGTTSTELLKYADQQMYKSKKKLKSRLSRL